MEPGTQHGRKSLPPKQRAPDSSSEWENDITKDSRLLRGPFEAKLKLDVGLKSMSDVRETDRRKEEFMLDDRIGESEELELVKRLTEPLKRHTSDRQLHRKSGKQKGRRKRGASLEREITLLVLQNTPDVSLKKSAAFSPEELGGVGVLTTNDILSDLMVTTCDVISSVSSQSKETIRRINKTAERLAKISSHEESPEQEKSEEQVDDTSDPVDADKLVKEAQQKLLPSNASDKADIFDIPSQNADEWAAFDDCPAFDYSLLPSQTLDQNGFPVFNEQGGAANDLTARDEDTDGANLDDELRAEEEQMAAELSKEMADELERERVLQIAEALAANKTEEVTEQEMTRENSRKISEARKAMDFEADTVRKQAPDVRQRPLELVEEADRAAQQDAEKLAAVNKKNADREEQAINRLRRKEQTIARKIAKGMAGKKSREEEQVAIDSEFMRAQQQTIHDVSLDLENANQSSYKRGRSDAKLPFKLHPRSLNHTANTEAKDLKEYRDGEDDSFTSNPEANQIKSPQEKAHSRGSSPEREDSSQSEMPGDRVDSPLNGKEIKMLRQDGRHHRRKEPNSPDSSSSEASPNGKNPEEPKSPASVADFSPSSARLADRYSRARAFVKRRSEAHQPTSRPKPTWNPKPPKHYSQRGVGNQA